MKRPSARELALGSAAAVALFVVAVLAIVWWEEDGSWDARPASGYELDDEGTRLVVRAGCHPEMRAEVVAANDDRVEVLLETRGDDVGGDCSGGAAVALSSPLGTRRVVDAVSGDTLDRIG
ncbi:MAG: hypothetical protein R8F63_04400 [Acidimicrobiales bacterium]|nr:hypothetical protein [Acidimicrobiales bacterium]